MERIKEIIVEMVESVQGCKAIDLIVPLTKRLIQEELETDDLPKLIEDLVSEGRLVEIEYHLPSQPNRVKSFLLPSDSVVEKFRQLEYYEQLVEDLVNEENSEKLNFYIETLKIHGVEDPTGLGVKWMGGHAII